MFGGNPGCNTGKCDRCPVALLLRFHAQQGTDRRLFEFQLFTVLLKFQRDRALRGGTGIFFLLAKLGTGIPDLSTQAALNLSFLLCQGALGSTEGGCFLLKFFLTPGTRCEKRYCISRRYRICRRRVAASATTRSAPRRQSLRLIRSD